MSVLKDILQKLETAKNPIAQAIHKGDHFRVLGLAFKKGMILKEHQAHMPSKLTVLSGLVVYREGEKEIKLEQYEACDIPVNITHSVEALEDSMCLLSQG